MVKKPIFSALIGVLILGGLTFGVVAEPPSIDKCTCDLKRESQPDNGAWVKNASACWSVENYPREWCDIVVQSLTNSKRKKAFVERITILAGANNDTAIADLLFERFEAFLGTLSDSELERAGLKRSDLKSNMPSLIKRNSKQLGRCVSHFEQWMQKPDQFKEINEERFRCRIGTTSGWLLISFEFSEAIIVYRLAPNG